MKARKDRDATFAYQNAGGLKDSIQERGRSGYLANRATLKGRALDKKPQARLGLFDVPGNEDYGLLHGGQNG